MQGVLRIERGFFRRQKCESASWPNSMQIDDQRENAVCFFIPFIFFTLPFSLPPSRNSDPGSQSTLFFPLPITVRALHFDREKSSAHPSLPDSRRICTLYVP